MIGRLLHVVLFLVSFSFGYSQNFPTFTFEGVTIIPHDYVCPSCEGEKMGGLSGIEYHPATQAYYLVADKPPARYFKIQLDTLPNPGITYTGIALLQPSRAEPESIRIRPGTSELYIANEHHTATSIISPSGKMAMRQKHRLMQKNAGLESLTFSSDGRRMWVAFERALKTEKCSGDTQVQGLVRILEYDLKIAEVVQKEYAYPLHRWTNIGENENGVTEILHWKNQQLLILERTYSSEQNKNYIRLFGVDLAKVTNVMKMSLCALPEEAKVLVPQLLFDFEVPIKAGQLARVDNAE
ncbi:MAG: esterase-like activity of phytase family protein, partial [Bacteroidota bacterium]